MGIKHSFFCALLSIFLINLPMSVSASSNDCHSCQELHVIEIGTFHSEKSISELKLSPNGRQLGFLVRDSRARPGLIKKDLYVTSTSGGPTQIINTDWPTGGSISSFDFSDDSLYLIFVGDKGTDYRTKERTYWVSYNGSEFTEPRVNKSLDGSVSIIPFTNIDRQILYKSRLGLFTLDLNAKKEPSPKQLAPKGLSSIVLGADANRVYYLRDEREQGDLLGPKNLYETMILDGSTKMLNHPLLPSVWSSVKNFQLSKNQHYVAYIANLEEDDRYDLYAKNLIDGKDFRLNEKPAHTNGDVYELEISHNSKHVVYLADSNLNNVHELFSVPFASPETSVRLSPDWITSLAENQNALNTFNAIDVQNFKLSLDSDYVAFRTPKGIYTSDLQGRNLTLLSSSERKIQSYRFVGPSIVITYADSNPDIEVFSAATGERIYHSNNTEPWSLWLQLLSIEDGEHLYYRNKNGNQDDLVSVNLKTLDTPRIVAKIPKSQTGPVTWNILANGQIDLFYSTAKKQSKEIIPFLSSLPILANLNFLSTETKRITLWKQRLDLQ